MGFSTFKADMAAGKRLVGTFQKTPRHEVVECLALAGLDFVCLDTEHSPFSRSELDACLAMARALDFPALVRVGADRPELILQALDSGAVGVVVPHIYSVEKAEGIAKAAHFGKGGRGFAGATRWAGLGRQSFPEILAQSAAETVVLAQIEEPEGVDLAGQIAAVDGIDGLFIGPADLSIAYGEPNLTSQALNDAFTAVGGACRDNGKALVTFVGNDAKAAEWDRHGINVFFVASDVTFMINAAKDQFKKIQDL